ncbi:TlyA family RNA methyltransferase [Candidatus Saccharibacteria bacterium]|nr:TlyA family RNA methyltransferase [Candidatus Saccharibacteria bacterium]
MTEFVSRAENKLKNAVESFGYDFYGKTVLDIGSSTGGFTEYALSRGANLVVAIEKGTNQMKAPLRFDKRVDLHEKTDIFDITKDDIMQPDVILADVSFVSLKKILRYVQLNLSDKSTDFLVMLKPQFEAQKHQLTRGVVKNEKIRREIIHNFENWLRDNDFLILKKQDNELLGKNGNRERFYWLKNIKKIS